MLNNCHRKLCHRALYLQNLKWRGVTGHWPSCCTLRCGRNKSGKRPNWESLPYSLNVASFYFVSCIPRCWTTRCLRPWFSKKTLWGSTWMKFMSRTNGWSWLSAVSHITLLWLAVGLPKCIGRNFGLCRSITPAEFKNELRGSRLICTVDWCGDVRLSERGSVLKNN